MTVPLISSALGGMKCFAMGKTGIVSTRVPAAVSVVTNNNGLRRDMSSTAKVWIDKNTRVICQGFTGNQVRIVYRFVSTVLSSYYIAHLWN